MAGRFKQIRGVATLIAALSVWGAQTVAACDLGAGIRPWHEQDRTGHATSPTAGAIVLHPCDRYCPGGKHLAHMMTVPASMEPCVNPLASRQHAAQHRAVSFESFLAAPPNRPPNA